MKTTVLCHMRDTETQQTQMLPSSSLLYKASLQHANTGQKSVGAIRQGKGPQEMSSEQQRKRSKPLTEEVKQ